VSEQQDLIARAVVAERQRILAELHDILGQELTMLALECDLALAADPDGPGGPALRRIRRRADRLVRSVGDLARSAPPVSLRDCLTRAGQHLDLAGIELRLDVPADLGHIDAETDALLGCVVREGVTNVLRHAPAATSCQISLLADDDLVLVIRNDGPAGPVPSRLGAGIAGLRHRAAPLGARIQVTGGPNLFQVSARVPRWRPRPRAAELSMTGS
jgi:two-component system sensor histidine kinase DesK